MSSSKLRERISARFYRNRVQLQVRRNLLAQLKSLSEVLGR